MQCGETGKNLIFFLAHFEHKEIFRRLNRLRFNLPVDHEVSPLVNSDSTPELRTFFGGGATFVSSDEVLTHEFAQRMRATSGTPVPGNVDQLLLAAIAKRPEYDYYWVVEYDVVFRGKWRNFFDEFCGNTADFLGTSFQKYTDTRNWFWWPDFDVPAEKGWPGDENVLLGFFPVMRLSKKAAMALVRSLAQERWRGHMEAVVPTILYNEGYRIEDIGGASFLTPHGRINKFYRNTLTDSARIEKGTFRYRPELRAPGVRRSYLYHPVKVPERVFGRRSICQSVSKVFFSW